MSLTARNSSFMSLGQSPIEQITGQMPDILEYLDFSLYDWIWYHDNAGIGINVFDHWIGVSHCIGISCLIRIVHSIVHKNKYYRARPRDFGNNVIPKYRGISGMDFPDRGILASKCTQNPAVVWHCSTSFFVQYCQIHVQTSNTSYECTPTQWKETPKTAKHNDDRC